jgi:hypothetical protein
MGDALPGELKLYDKYCGSVDLSSFCHRHLIGAVRRPLQDQEWRLDLRDVEGKSKTN